MSVLLKQETDKRVSESAANQLGEVLEKFCEDVASDAISLASQDGYQTVKSKPITRALKQVQHREYHQSYL